jgi:hypothetical protein
VPHGDLLAAFAEAVLGEDDNALSRARTALATALGPRGLVDAAGVVGLFKTIDRVADATGIPLEPEKAAASADFRAALDVDRFAGAERLRGVSVVECATVSSTAAASIPAFTRLCNRLGLSVSRGPP